MDLAMTLKKHQAIEFNFHLPIPMKTSNPSFTQNKWLVITDGILWSIVDEGDLPICIVSIGHRSPAVTNALANLIRTAPELLAIVHLCMRSFHERLDVLRDERRHRLRHADEVEDLDYQIGRIRALVRKCDSVIGLAERLGDPRP